LGRVQFSGEKKSVERGLTLSPKTNIEDEYKRFRTTREKGGKGQNRDLMGRLNPGAKFRG